MSVVVAAVVAVIIIAVTVVASSSLHLITTMPLLSRSVVEPWKALEGEDGYASVGKEGGDWTAKEEVSKKKKEKKRKKKSAPAEGKLA
jgi:hypothetical protein